MRIGRIRGKKMAKKLDVAWALAFIFLLVSYPAEAVAFKRYFHPDMSRIKVHDGDTICYVKKPWHGIKLEDCWRLYGIDTPEINKACSKKIGTDARDELNRFIHSGRMLVSLSVQQEKFGRHLARVRVGKQDAASLLISKNMAKPYMGKGQRPNWCQT
jgi:endonuclease YncB( thermonuclease family)